ncbi:MAG: ATP-binding protein [Geodermatophilaceae bacterium]|nr:ATP-binding protein [Geodermatophilaceae bacterium]
MPLGYPQRPAIPPCPARRTVSLAGPVPLPWNPQSGEDEPVLVGRDSELRRVALLLADARSGRAGVAGLVGAAGVGKTALLDSAADAAGRARRHRSAAKCGPAGRAGRPRHRGRRATPAAASPRAAP